MVRQKEIGVPVRQFLDPGGVRASSSRAKLALFHVIATYGNCRRRQIPYVSKLTLLGSPKAKCCSYAGFYRIGVEVGSSRVTVKNLGRNASAPRNSCA
eukprot:949346-Rhodomonas_salina.1